MTPQLPQHAAHAIGSLQASTVWPRRGALSLPLTCAAWLMVRMKFGAMRAAQKRT